MKYTLSFCDIIQIADNIFETIDREGITIDKECADDAWKFWDGLRKKPFGLLVNCKNSYSFSFEGAREIGTHPLQKNTAILVNNATQQKAFETKTTTKFFMRERQHLNG